ncbi:hypothetical protein DIZ81_10855 [Legionella taurinensis]|uniref:DrrA phosphatidylinositol 4-phosphate binding domain-containing protein n=1 Tax=Legionella taurinensis TaxID=70611 RepID=A0A3A5LAX5_9GAMM|nr:hypothetical protein [Legionella taurinensis]MDX1838347.1 hypothetical protein [Legionella taurinensis]PUT39110.1 hypothetical protein DB744_10865 [Legionella taurinensis]PUT39564.1 hypothetical protein DB746_13520 [Legionella taurinensis]PUT43566.1 hypothetical protein DB743_10255 [Legionella taurinensis]PUT45220.1 hypothetical protein DB745_13460 [Legionella taurinensis]
MPLSAKNITSYGVDVTPHYLGSENQSFKIFRYEKAVYAVRYDGEDAIDFVHLWGSHKGEMQSKNEYLGAGVFGQVFKKTEDKAFKELGSRHYKGTEIKKNLTILEQKFLLKEQGIDEYFVLGLWNIKDKSHVVFNMPKLSLKNPTKDHLKPLYEQFVLGLKKLNERGYHHPDLANHPWHTSPQNLLPTAEGIKAIDLDEGFCSNESSDEKKVFGRDQWLYVYNYRFPPENTVHNQWRQEIENWYNKHKGQALSDHLPALLTLHHQGKIALPASIVNELHLKNSEKAVEEYRAGSKENRTHAFHEVSVEDTTHDRFKSDYKGIKGDALKRSILRALKDELAEAETKEELLGIKTRFLSSPEMDILNTPQGKFTHKLNLKTDSNKAVEKLFAAAEKRINDADSVKTADKSVMGKF